MPENGTEYKKNYKMHLNKRWMLQRKVCKNRRIITRKACIKNPIFNNSRDLFLHMMYKIEREKPFKRERKLFQNLNKSIIELFYNITKQPTTKPYKNYQYLSIHIFLVSSVREKVLNQLTLLNLCGFTSLSHLNNLYK